MNHLMGQDHGQLTFIFQNVEHAGAQETDPVGIGVGHDPVIRDDFDCRYAQLGTGPASKGVQPPSADSGTWKNPSR
jgi:hypothetical protein